MPGRLKVKFVRSYLANDIARCAGYMKDGRSVDDLCTSCARYHFRKDTGYWTPFTQGTVLNDKCDVYLSMRVPE